MIGKWFKIVHPDAAGIGYSALLLMLSFYTAIRRVRLNPITLTSAFARSGTRSTTGTLMLKAEDTSLFVIV